MPNAWIADMTHYLDDSGCIVEMPTRVRRLADHFGAIVAAMSTQTPEKVVRTQVRCRRRPGRRACASECVTCRRLLFRIGKTPHSVENDVTLLPLTSSPKRPSPS